MRWIVEETDYIALLERSKRVLNPDLSVRDITVARPAMLSVFFQQPEMFNDDFYSRLVSFLKALGEQRFYFFRHNEKWGRFQQAYGRTPAIEFSLDEPLRSFRQIVCPHRDEPNMYYSSEFTACIGDTDRWVADSIYYDDVAYVAAYDEEAANLLKAAFQSMHLYSLAALESFVLRWSNYQIDRAAFAANYNFWTPEPEPSVLSNGGP